jgi:hypothetical protein
MDQTSSWKLPSIIAESKASFTIKNYQFFKSDQKIDLKKVTIPKIGATW